MIHTALHDKAREHADEIVSRMDLKPADRRLMLKQAEKGHPTTLFALAMRGQQLGII